MKVYGERTEHGEVVLHSNVMDERDELARRFIIRAAARDALERQAASEGHTRVLPNTCEESRQMKGIAWVLDESRQVDELLMDAVEQMNLFEGVGKTASSPQFKRARLLEPLDDEQEKMERTKQN